MKLLMENWRKYIAEEKKASDIVDMPDTIKTFGDLKRIIEGVLQIYKAVELGKLGEDAAVDAVHGIINALTGGMAGNVKNIVGAVIKSKDLAMLAKTTKLPDEDTIASPFMSMFNIDDDYSKLMDNNLENEFINHLAKIIKNVDDDLPLVKFNANDILRQFIKDKFQLDCADLDGETGVASTIKTDVVKTQAIQLAKTRAAAALKRGTLGSIGLDE